MTIAHFGLCDWTNFKINKYKYSISFTYGMTIIFGIIFFNEDQSFLIFEYLTNDNVYLFQKYFYIPYFLTFVCSFARSTKDKILNKGPVENTHEP